MFPDLQGRREWAPGARQNANLVPETSAAQGRIMRELPMKAHLDVRGPQF